MNHRQQVSALKQENGELRDANVRLTQVNKAQAETIEDRKKAKPSRKSKDADQPPLDLALATIKKMQKSMPPGEWDSAHDKICKLLNVDPELPKR